SSWELSKAKEYDYLLINDDLDKACEELKTIIKASRLLIRNFDLSKYKW
ncbi:guanylate kinase, partial [bacterium]|nr:guanylate kinase [bacterium]